MTVVRQPEVVGFRNGKFVDLENGYGRTATTNINHLSTIIPSFGELILINSGKGKLYKCEGSFYLTFATRVNPGFFIPALIRRSFNEGGP
jgi:hypothetical protein